MKEMKEIKGLPIEFMESGIEKKLQEIFEYRICFYNQLNSEEMKETFELYSKDLWNDGYKLINEGIAKFYPGHCNIDYMSRVHKWYDNVDLMLLDLRIELMHKFNIDNPYITLRKYKKSMKEGK